jgi:hypothetical protein
MRDRGIFVPPSPRSRCSVDWDSILYGDDDSGGGGGTSDLIGHIIDQAAHLTNTALLSDANPVNTAILTNTPISTPQYAVGTSNSMVAWVVAGLAIFGGLAFVALDRR